MPFSSAQVDWLAKTQQSAIDFEAMIAKQDARNALLADVSQDVLGFQEDLMAATSDLKVEWQRDKFLGLIERSNRTMDWNKGDRDNEVDTVHDLRSL